MLPSAQKNWNSQNFEVENIKNTEVENIKNTIEKQVDERGFFLYEWISKEELNQAIKHDYIQLNTKLSIPMTILGFLGWIIGYAAGNVFLLFGGVFLVFLFMYGVLGIILLYKIGVKWKIFAKFANITITDNYLISGGKVIKNTDFKSEQAHFATASTTFFKNVFEKSNAEHQIIEQKRHFSQQIKKIFEKGTEIIQSIGNSSHSSRNNPQGVLIIIAFAVMLCFAISFSISYFLWLPIAYFLAKIASNMAYKKLLKNQKTEYKIQNLFGKIDNSSKILFSEKGKSITFLTQAENNEWIDNLSGRLEKTFTQITTSAESATNNSIQLRKTLEESDYKNLFNFGKYDNWVKKQILDPISEIITLLEKNQKLLENTKENIHNQIQTTEDPSHQKPLQLQNIRLDSQIQNIEKILQLLRSYQNKLI